MSQTIECPGCEKRFRLGDRPPATYTCKQCGTVMDLSDFGGTSVPEPAAAASAPATRSQRRKGAPTSRARGGGGGPPSRRRARGGASASRGRAAARRRNDDYDDYEDDYRPRGRPKQSNAGLYLILGTVGVVVLGLVIALISKKDPVQIDDSALRAAQNSGVVNRSVGAMGGARPGLPSAAGASVGDAMPTRNGGGTNNGASDGADSGGGNSSAGTSSGRKRMGRHNVKKFKLRTFPWQDEVDADTRAKVEEAITAMYRGDRKSREAQTYLVGLGRVVGGRLVSEFHTIANSETFDSREGRMKAQNIDATLRKMDGWMERYWDEGILIQITTPPDTVIGLAKRWIVWWEKGYWKDKPLDPWDPMTDKFRWEQKDDPKKKRSSGKKGWDKRNK